MDKNALTYSYEEMILNAYFCQLSREGKDAVISYAKQLYQEEKDEKEGDAT